MKLERPQFKFGQYHDWDAAGESQYAGSTSTGLIYRLREDFTGYDAANVLISRLNISDDNARKSIRSALNAISDNTSDENPKRYIRDSLKVQR